MATPVKALRNIDDPFHDLLDADTNAANVTAAMRIDNPIEAGPALIPKARYISREYHELEKEHLWSRVWQQAAHEDDFANVGDVVPYDIVDQSYLVVRTGEDEYKQARDQVDAMGDKKLADWLTDNPKVIQRPIVVSAKGARIGRPPESVLEILD